MEERRRAGAGSPASTLAASSERTKREGIYPDGEIIGSKSPSRSKKSQELLRGNKKASGKLGCSLAVSAGEHDLPGCDYSVESWEEREVWKFHGLKTVERI